MFKFTLDLLTKPVTMGAVLACGTAMAAKTMMSSASAQALDTKLNPRPVVISGPSGAGKSTLFKRIMAEYPGVFALSVSHTTRKPRAGEADGVDYHFTDKEVMRAAIARGEFVEHAEFGGNIYGTSKRAIEDVAGQSKICVLDIERQGCENIRALPEFSPLFVFIQPPSMELLEERLRARGTESDDSLAKRLAEATSAFEYGNTPGKFDHIVVNDDLEKAYADFKACLMPEIENAQRLQAAHKS
eukprot:TRINITY_DN11980_c0_g1_i1.p1 TRINITY_DN11980_c0_g1~~TRINITY_DN11980_c0_g1_i1.p1  ORF type:complete len:244 (+),score=56.35 TRINITY_DN11980_c0_g1_i1:274-1005(+)